MRRAVCDATGSFKFENIPEGSWFVGTKVTWQVPHIVQSGEKPGPLASLIFGIKPPPDFDTQGGELRKLVTVVAGDSQVLLTGSDEVKYRQEVLAGALAQPRKVTSDNAPVLGITVTPLPVSMAAAFKLDSGHGLWVLKITDSGAASRAGLKIGDVILSANGSAWDTTDEMARTINSLTGANILSLKIWRSGTEQTIEVRF